MCSVVRRFRRLCGRHSRAPQGRASVPQSERPPRSHRIGTRNYSAAQYLSHGKSPVGTEEADLSEPLGVNLRHAPGKSPASRRRPFGRTQPRYNSLAGRKSSGPAAQMDRAAVSYIAYVQYVKQLRSNMRERKTLARTVWESCCEGDCEGKAIPSRYEIKTHAALSKSSASLNLPRLNAQAAKRVHAAQCSSAQGDFA